MSDKLFDPASPSRSARKAESNRRNARKSTGPKTARGKSWSRRNALKHGLLASQAVIATTEGRAERAMFEQLVEGLVQDFAPIGTFEQTLVQQIAACFWRQRRVLRFENRAAFQSRENRTFREMNDPRQVFQPQYEIDGHPLEGTGVLDRAGLGLDLPSEADTMRLIRYEGSITRSLKNALAQLKAAQQARRKDSAAKTSAGKKDHQMVIDLGASERNRGPSARRISAIDSRLIVRRRLEKIEDDEEEVRRAEEAQRAASGEAATEASEIYQTKPNLPEDPEALLRHQRLLETANTIVKLGASLAPRRGPGGD